ncbi:DUF2768 domain-containing protein [Macrococcus brunensis]|uniref:DUF2768 domain-containing protein n=1 Tax=Macrococcus brunensis TaxID=198483 RepID=A0A4R6BDK6_9STAP|nr:DUF2768 domain-containing protein [Macrococcus brunensis]TDL97822.1 DUF2768 domain-containing protein [Macrococcus brunensis]ULG71030.1 DUF2768 domain-containing protein [Macrococcus brunensis]ULG73367.1 DUF2768 domain-containing protein [Macrococcus brunensis]
MFNITRMDLMWVSFYSLGLMMLAMVLIYLARFKVKNRALSITLSILAYGSLLLSGLLMIIVLGGSSHA